MLLRSGKSAGSSNGSSNDSVPGPSRTPALQTFTLFPKLPLELRVIIWRLSLEPRTIEVQFHHARGFYTRVPTPTALRVSHDSREAVSKLYPICFGNHIFPPRIPFNFAMDILFFENAFQGNLLHFLASLKETELSRIRYLAVDHYLEEDWEIGGWTYQHLFDSLKRITPRMAALKELIFVHDVMLSHECCGIPDGDGPMKVYDKWPSGAFCCRCLDDDIDEPCEYHEVPEGLPEEIGDTSEFKAPKIITCWGWRPIP